MPVFEMPLEELRHYKGCSPCPGDFKEYWREALGELEATGLAYTCTPAAFEAPGVKCHDLWFVGTGGARVHCMFLKPFEKNPCGCGIPRIYAPRGRMV